MGKNYWGQRIHVAVIDYFASELRQGRLRQGWGYDPGQDLRNLTVDEGASGNYPIYNNVKKGDIILIPRLPDWNHVTIAEATADFNEGYRFEISEGQEDYGHIFPAMAVAKFVRYAKDVSGGVRRTLHCRSRFWNMTHLAEEIEVLIKTEPSELDKSQDNAERFESAVFSSLAAVFKAKEFEDKFYETLVREYSLKDWEDAIAYGLSKLYPHYSVEITGDSSEGEHGTDVLVRIPGIHGMSYGVAIQVKDYEGPFNPAKLEQIKKADAYWLNREGLKIVDKYLLVTKSRKEENPAILGESEVKVIFAGELKELSRKFAYAILGLKDA